MKSLTRIGNHPVSLPLSADDIVEFHAARLLLLLKLCGTSGRIDGLTKMAKLDFFARYPEFFEIARRALEQATSLPSNDAPDESPVESAMVRHHYGPWDKRYYHVLAYLEAKGLIAISKPGKAYQIALTNVGSARASILQDRDSFAPLVERMRAVKKTFGGKSGNALKTLIYRLFEAEVGDRPMGEVISK